MKVLNLFLLVLCSYLNAQELPFCLNTLDEHKALSTDSISPRLKDGRFYYFLKTGQKAFLKNFEEAYPFVGKSALVKNNNKYGIIDLKGNYLIKPSHKKFRLPSYEPHLIVFSKNLLFNLSTGIKMEKADDYIYCEEPAVPSPKPFLKKYDSIIDIDFNFYTVKLKNKIGVINSKEEIIIPFNYTNITISRGGYYTTPQRIGLQNGRNWFYFDLPHPKVILSSKYECITMHNLVLKNAIGVFKKGKRFSILFKNGNTLNDSYDWISENGLIGRKNKSVYFLNSDGSSTLYYK